VNIFQSPECEFSKKVDVMYDIRRLCSQLYAPDASDNPNSKLHYNFIDVQLNTYDYQYCGLYAIVFAVQLLMGVKAEDLRRDNFSFDEKDCEAWLTECINKKEITPPPHAQLTNRHKKFKRCANKK